MKRRDILKYTAYMTGAAVSLPLMTTLLTGCKTDAVATAPDFKLSFFSEEDFSFIQGMVDTILPETNSPSASAVGVHKMIDSMLANTYNQEDLAVYKKGFEAFKKYLKEIVEGDEFNYQLEKMEKGKSFLELEQDDRIKILKSLDTSSEYKDARDGYLALKQQTIGYYLNTEEIATEFLNYLPVPGEYDGCIDLASVDGKAWAI